MEANDCHTQHLDWLMLPMAVSLIGLAGTLFICGLLAFVALVCGAEPIPPPTWLRSTGIGSLVMFPVGCICMSIMTRLERKVR